MVEEERLKRNFEGRVEVEGEAEGEGGWVEGGEWELIVE